MNILGGAKGEEMIPKLEAYIFSAEWIHFVESSELEWSLSQMFHKSLWKPLKPAGFCLVCVRALFSHSCLKIRIKSQWFWSSPQKKETIKSRSYGMFTPVAFTYNSPFQKITPHKNPVDQNPSTKFNSSFVLCFFCGGSPLWKIPQWWDFWTPLQFRWFLPPFPEAKVNWLEHAGGFCETKRENNIAWYFLKKDMRIYIYILYNILYNIYIIYTSLYVII